MALRPYYLGDTSALARRPKAEVAARLDPLLEAGLVARCSVTDLEARYSSTCPADHAVPRQRRGAWPFVSIDQQVLDRAVSIQDRLAEPSHHRGAKIADPLIAAAAAGLVVLHSEVRRLARRYLKAARLANEGPASSYDSIPRRAIA